MLLLLLAGCAAGSQAPVAEAPALADYDDIVAGIEASRLEHGERWARASTSQRPAVLEESREVVTGAILDELFPRWAGTDWAFYGTTTRPREGSIACGYYVSTVLEHAGFQVERVSLAQQASEHIILSLVPRPEVQRFSRAPGQDIVDAVNAGGNGLYLLGLDYHVAFLTKRGDEVQMCHSSALGTGGVLCEDALTSPAMPSGYRVLGKLLSDEMMQAWLEGAALRTVTR